MGVGMDDACSNMFISSVQAFELDIYISTVCAKGVS